MPGGTSINNSSNDLDMWATCAARQQLNQLVPGPCSFVLVNGSCHAIRSRRCLQQWQHTLLSQGQLSRAFHCDICRQPYQQPQFDPDANLPLWQRLKQHWVQLQSSPEWAFKVWRCCILIGGLVSSCCSVCMAFASGLPRSAGLLAL
jgi:hypothetical protein